MELVDMRGSKPRPVRGPGSIPGVGNSMTLILYMFNFALTYIKTLFYSLLTYFLLTPSLLDLVHVEHYLTFNESQACYFYALNWLKGSAIMADAFHMFFFYLIIIIILSLLYLIYSAR